MRRPLIVLALACVSLGSAYAIAALWPDAGRAPATLFPNEIPANAGLLHGGAGR